MREVARRSRGRGSLNLQTFKHRIIRGDVVLDIRALPFEEGLAGRGQVFAFEFLDDIHRNLLTISLIFSIAGAAPLPPSPNPAPP